MREYLFKGQRADSGEWVKGFLLSQKEKYYICPNPYKCLEGISFAHGDFYGFKGWFEVIPETVGQYTGLKDKNGKKVFEDDIVICYDRKFICKWDEANYEFVLENLNESFSLVYADSANIEVIGSIHDKEGGAE